MHSPTHHTLKIEKSAYYSTLGEANSKVKYLWIVCHGYGQLASQIIHKFSSVLSEEHFFIAPEGLSRFYWDSNAGIVGASWMTKKDRLDEINDYCNYIQSLVDQYSAKCSDEVKVVAFGFSQGVATVWRWMMDKKPSNLASLVMWAGMTPEDLNYPPHKDYLSNVALHSVFGTADEFLTEERVKFQENLELEQGLEISHSTFDGKHVVDRETLIQLFPQFLPDDSNS